MYLAVDCETGGLGIEKSLLSVAFILTDDKFIFKDSLILNVRPDNDVYIVTGQALGINKIDLWEHTRNSIQYKDAGSRIYEFLNLWSLSGKDKITIVGKNVYFDLLQLWDKLIRRNTWEQFCSYRVVDISGVWKYLEIIGKVPALPNTGLKDLCEYFNMEIRPDHTAETDALATMQVFRRMCQL